MPINVDVGNNRFIEFSDIETANAYFANQGKVPEKQGWLKDWLGRPQGVFEEPTTFGEASRNGCSSFSARKGRSVWASWC